MATAAMTIGQHVLQRIQPVIVAGLGQAERRQHHHAHAGAEEAAIDGGEELRERADQPIRRRLLARLRLGLQPGPAANSAVAASSSQGTRARNDGLSSASRISAPASAPTAEMSASSQRAAPEKLDVAPIGERRGDVAGKLRDRGGGVGRRSAASRASDIAPKVMNVPPPAMALTAPETKTCKEERRASRADILREAVGSV